MSFSRFLKRVGLAILDDQNTREVELEVKFAQVDNLFSLSTKSWFTPFMQVHNCVDVRAVFTKRLDVDLIFTIKVRTAMNPTARIAAEQWLRAGLQPAALGYDVGEYRIVKTRVSRFYLEDEPRTAPLGSSIPPVMSLAASDVMERLNPHIQALYDEFIIFVGEWDVTSSRITCDPLEIEILEDETGALWVRIAQIKSGEAEQFSVTSIGNKQFIKTLRDMALEAGAELRQRPSHEH